MMTIRFSLSKGILHDFLDIIQHLFLLVVELGLVFLHIDLSLYEQLG